MLIRTILILSCLYLSGCEIGCGPSAIEFEYCAKACAIGGRPMFRMGKECVCASDVADGGAK
jgi:hypothetical protein